MIEFSQDPPGSLPVDSKVEELVASIASNEKDLAEATEIRAKEAEDFAALKEQLGSF